MKHLSGERVVLPCEPLPYLSHYTPQSQAHHLLTPPEPLYTSLHSTHRHTHAHLLNLPLTGGGSNFGIQLKWLVTFITVLHYRAACDRTGI